MQQQSADADLVPALVFAIESAEEPRSMTICMSGGDSSVVDIDPDRDYGFDLHHLVEHMDRREPIAVKLNERDGRIYVEKISDSDVFPAGC